MNSVFGMTQTNSYSMCTEHHAENELDKLNLDSLITSQQKKESTVAMFKSVLMVVKRRRRTTTKGSE